MKAFITVQIAVKGASQGYLAPFSPPVAGCPALIVLGAVTLRHLPLCIIPLEEERQTQDVVTWLDLLI